ncbi:MAG TPA: PstS family phosphate ABC transporter substrate-binding protein [Polyangiales bacterium]
MTIKRYLGVLAALTAAACSNRPAADSNTAPAPAPSAAAPAAAPAAPAAPSVIAIDGSSTVFPITEAVAEEFQKTNPAKVTIGVSGTGGGFKKFCAGEIAVAGASRPVKPAETVTCTAAKIEYIELPVAYDGLAVVVNTANTWAKSMTVAELKRLWEPAAQGKVMKWSSIRAGWPAKDVHLFGPGVDSGTYDYFTKAINGEEHKSRGDYTSSEDDNVLVQGVSRDPLALGFFGLAYFAENSDKLKLVPVDDGNDANGKGPIAASQQTVRDGTYQPLSRPLFIYVSKAAAARPEVSAFVEFYMTRGEKLVNEAHYVALPAKAYELSLSRFKKGTVGTLFGGAGGSQVGETVEALLAREQ